MFKNQTRKSKSFSNALMNEERTRKKVSHQFRLDLEKYNSQYQPITVKNFNKSHDRFLIIDDEIYHLGASLKDLGKKWFAFSILHCSKELLLNNLCQ